MTKIAILQPNYIPWKGVFDMINQVDKFVFLDDAQFTRSDWRTRNKIKTANGSIWLSVPVKNASLETKINEIQICQRKSWQKKHLISITQSYSKAPYFSEYYYLLEEIYEKRKWENLADFNIHATMLMLKILEIETEVFKSSDMNIQTDKDDRLIDICKQLGGDFYLSGPAAQNYIVNEKFERENISLAYIKYDYPEYQQMYGEFDHHVTILDLLFNCGLDKELIFQNKYDVVL